MARVMFMDSPQVDRTYPFGDRSLTVLREEPYTRVRDGEPSTLLVWGAKCADCSKDFEFKTGTTTGDMQTRCLPCYRAVEEAKVDCARRDRTSETPAPAATVWNAVRLAQATDPKPMSMARNTSRQSLYAPALLRRTVPHLLDKYTLEDIHVGLEQALAHGLIGWKPVGRYHSGNARRGLFARDEAFLQKMGRLPKTADVFS